jgi:hypothetical protein
VGWTLEPVWTTWKGENLTPTGTRTPTLRPSSPQLDAAPTILSRLPKLELCYTVILSMVTALYGCETWPLTLGEKHRFRTFENKDLRSM